MRDAEELVEFIERCLDDEEKAALGVLAVEEHAFPVDEFETSYYWGRTTRNRGNGSQGVGYAPGAPTPQEVLDDVASKRRLLLAFGGDVPHRLVLTCLAWPFRHRDGWRDLWTPLGMDGES